MTLGAKQKIIRLWEQTGILHTSIFKQLRSASSKDFTGIVDALTECQSKAIQVGNYVEAYSANDAEGIVRGLEEYCEQIYQLSIAMQDISLVQTDVFYESISDYGRTIREELEGLAVRTEIVFMPYKMSMWDSLESIWREASNDDRCDVFVVPIPYYDKNANGLLAEWHYEGKQFPSYVSVTSFEQYSIDEHMPDIVYIHNPYDGYNLVTSVASDYYSSELKKYVRKLVYVPYYYAGSVLSDHQNSMPTLDNMDFIILPSEAAVEKMSVYQPREKLLPLGSPKIDRMLRLDGYGSIPEEWRKLAKGKKIILYNVGLSPILQNRYRSIEKMRMVFNTFKKRQDVLLWWRPHPLIKASLHAIAPEIEGAYEELEKEFLLERIGIYDTGADSNLAVASTDAFVGDYSSMIYMFGVTGKPVFYLDNRILEEKSQYKNYVIMTDFDIDREGNLIFMSAVHEVLCKLCVETGEISLVDQYSSYDLIGQEYKILIDEEYLILSPCGCNENIKIINLRNQSYVQYEVQKDYVYHNYLKPIKIDDEYVFCPGAKQEFLIYNKKNNCFETYGDFADELCSYVSGENNLLFIGDPVVIDRSIYLLVCGTNRLLKFDVKNRIYRFYSIGTEKKEFSNMDYDEKVFWMITKNGECIAQWNPNTNDYVEYSNYPKGFLPYLNAFVHSDSRVFSHIVLMKDWVYIFPGTANMILMLNKMSGEMKECDWKLPYLEGQRKGTAFTWSDNYLCVKKYDEHRIIAVTAYDYSILVIDIETSDVNIYKSCLEPENMEKLISPLRARFIGGHPPYIICENGLECCLNDFLDYIVDEQAWSRDKQIASFTGYTSNMDGTCGSKVHHCIMDKLEEENNAAI